MNGCLQGNTLLWILIILLILGQNGNVFHSSALSGCGIPVLIALGYCMYKNGTLANILNGNSCGCNNT